MMTFRTYRLAKALLVGSALCIMAGCGSSNTEVDGHNELTRFVADNQVGSDTDHWIEMQNAAGEWERVGLIFGYAGGDYDECQKAVSGLKQVNYAREYRCVPAQSH